MTKLVWHIIICAGRFFLILVHLFHFKGPSVMGGYSPELNSLSPPLINMTMYQELEPFRSVSIAKEFPSENGTFENDFVSRNGSEYIINKGTWSVAFSCEADYPVTWSIPEEMEKINSQYVFFNEFRVSHLTPSMDLPQTTHYITFIYISSVQETFSTVSGGLTCSSIDLTPALETNIFIYKTGKEVLQNERKIVTVYANPPDAMDNVTTLVIPCRPSSPKLKISLQKKDSAPSQKPNTSNILWKPMEVTGREVTFDPKIGFTIKRTLPQNSVLGLYRCLATSKKDDAEEDDTHSETPHFVLVNVLKGKSHSQNMSVVKGEVTFKEKLAINGKATYDISSSQGSLDFGNLKCCTGNGSKPSTLFLRDCESALHCKWERAAILKDEANTTVLQQPICPLKRSDDYHPGGCSATQIFTSMAVVKCTGENVDVLQYYIAVFHRVAGASVEERLQKLQKVERGSGIAKLVRLYEYVTASAAECMDVSRKMIIFVGNRFETPPIGARIRDLNYVRPIKRMLAWMYGDDDMKKLLGQNNSFVYEYDRDFYYSGESLTFVCVGVPAFYSLEGILRLNWRNGTKTVLTAPSGEGQDNIFLYLNDHAMAPLASKTAIGHPVSASEEMDSVDCFMPVVGSSRWEQISKKIQVKPRVAAEGKNGHYLRE